MKNDFLKYPLNIEKILRKKKSIKRELLLNSENFIKKNIAILGGSTTSEIKNILELFLLDNGIKPDFYESEYNRYYEEALFENDKLDKFNPDIIYIHVTNLNIVKFPKLTNNEKEINLLLNTEIEKYKSIWFSLEKYNCAIICVIHNNFGTSKMTGHLGSALAKKSETIIELEQNTVNKDWITVHCKQSRNYAFETFSFEVNDYGLPLVVDDLYDPLKSNG